MFMGSNGRKETNSEKIVLYAKKHKKYRVKNVQKSDGSGFKASLPQDKTETPAAEERRQPYRNEVYSGRQRKTEHIQGENVLSNVSETTNPEMAERLKKAAFIERRNAENIKMNRTAAAYGGEDYHDKISDVPVEHFEYKTENSKDIPLGHSEKKAAENAVTGHEKVIAPEMAERLKKAAFIERRNAENIKINRTAAAYGGEDHHDKISDVPVEHREETVKKAAEKPEDVIEDIVISDHVRAITPEMAERLKRAAYIEQKNAEAICLNRATVIRETEKETQETNTDNVESAENIPDVLVEHLDEESVISDSPEADISDKSEEIRKYREEKAYGEFNEKHRKNSKNDKSEITENVPITYAAGFPQEVFDVSQNVANTVNNSDSANGAVMDISTSLAVVEAKKRMKKLAQNDGKKQKRVKERLSYHGNRFGIGNDSRQEEIKDKNEKIVNEKQQEKHSGQHGISRLGNSRKMQEEKLEYAKKERAKEIKNKRKELFLNENREIAGTVYNSDPNKVDPAKIYLKKKAVSALIGGGALTAVLPILAIVLVYVVISAFFGWLSPFEYSLAGEEADPDTGITDMHNAETNKEMLDGYTLMTKNYFDVSQAYYYLNYGDWYGGTYSYPSAAEEISFADFFSQKCELIIRTIQEQFSAALASARTPEEAAAISSAMSQAISAALQQAQAEAGDEYLTLIENLDDCMTAEENRLHYEVKNNGGSNGTLDTVEFNGKPIVGTNHFENYEIQSAMSAEELVAMTALYKSLVLLKTNGKNDDGSEYDISITPDDIMKFFEETGYISITTEVTHNNTCAGQDCRRRIIGDYENGFEWEYYCSGDHDNLSGEIGNSLSKDELTDKIIELTDAEENGIDKNKCKEMFDEYIELICKELDISESDFRQFGSADNEAAMGFYEDLIDPTKGEIPNNYWTVETPIT